MDELIVNDLLTASICQEGCRLLACRLQQLFMCQPSVHAAKYSRSPCADRFRINTGIKALFRCI